VYAVEVVKRIEAVELTPIGDFILRQEVFKFSASLVQGQRKDAEKPLVAPPC
jgi:hypothetical protein